MRKRLFYKYNLKQALTNFPTSVAETSSRRSRNGAHVIWARPTARSEARLTEAHFANLFLINRCLPHPGAWRRGSITNGLAYNTDLPRITGDQNRRLSDPDIF
jgi:hypothetical protein